MIKELDACCGLRKNIRLWTDGVLPSSQLLEAKCCHGEISYSVLPFVLAQSLRNEMIWCWPLATSLCFPLTFPFLQG